MSELAADTMIKELADYRKALQNMLASEAVKVGLLKDAVRSIPELDALIRPFFEQCVRESHAAQRQLNPLAILSSCCFAGAAAAELWQAVEEDLLRSDFYALLSRGKGGEFIDDHALEFASMSANSPEGALFSASVRGNWSIMALAAWSGVIASRTPEEAMLFLQSTAQVLFMIGEAVSLARHEEE